MCMCMTVCVCTCHVCTRHVCTCICVACVYMSCVLHVQGSVRETLTVNQKECVAKIDQLNRNLERAWEKEQKVKALKIAI